jgi:hypothetical protein
MLRKFRRALRIATGGMSDTNKNFGGQEVDNDGCAEESGPGYGPAFGVEPCFMLELNSSDGTKAMRRN